VPRSSSERGHLRPVEIVPWLLAHSLSTLPAAPDRLSGKSYIPTPSGGPARSPPCCRPDHQLSAMSHAAHSDRPYSQLLLPNVPSALPPVARSAFHTGTAVNPVAFPLEGVQFCQLFAYLCLEVVTITFGYPVHWGRALSVYITMVAKQLRTRVFSPHTRCVRGQQFAGLGPTSNWVGEIHRRATRPLPSGRPTATRPAHAKPVPTPRPEDLLAQSLRFFAVHCQSPGPFPSPPEPPWTDEESQRPGRTVLPQRSSQDGSAPRSRGHPRGPKAGDE